MITAARQVLRTHIWAGLLAAGLAATSSGAALAAGALAIGAPPDVVHQGFAYSVNSGRPTDDDASADVLNNCRTTDKAPQSAKDYCTVVTTFHDKCAVVSMDPGAGTPGVGWAVATSLADAKKQAVDNCRTTAGDARKDYCEVSAWRCDGASLP